MKNALVFILFLFSLSLSAQTVAKKDANGNYTQTEVVKTVADLEKNATKTGATFTTKTGEVLPVYKSANGKLFVIAIGKTSGKPYRKYFKEVE